MKHLKMYALMVSAIGILLGSCSEWTEPEAYNFQASAQSEAYYENLRAWKNTWHERPITFGWYSGWNAVGTNMLTSLCGLPDSLDLVCMWGNVKPSNITEAMKKDLREVRDVKGTKVIGTTIVGWVGAGVLVGSTYTDHAVKEEVFGWETGWNTSATWCSSDPEIRARQEAAIRKYARMLADTILMADLDGFDIDWEPTVGGAGCKQEIGAKTNGKYDNFFILVDELGKYFGPMSGTDKLLVIDGEVEQLDSRFIPYFDLYLDQRYNISSFSTLNTGRARTLLNLLESDMGITKEELLGRYLISVDYESNRYTGGGTFSGYPTKIEAFASWQPTIDGVSYPRFGGVGGYHIEYEYSVPGKSGFYPTIRSAIQILNPAGAYNGNNQ